MKGFGEATPSRRSGQRMENFIDVFEWPTDDYASIRLIGPVFSVGQVWFKITTKRNPKGASIPKQCLDHDGETDKLVPGSNRCPYRKSGRGRLGKEYFVNAIIRDLQYDANDRELKFPAATFPAEKRLGYKAFWGKKGDDRKTPVRVVRIPESQVDKLKSLQKLNRVKTADGVRTFELSDEKYGCDIQIMIDSSKTGAAKYDIQKGDRTPITPTERRYIIYPLDLMKPETVEEATREMEDLAQKIIDEPKNGRGGGRDQDGGRDRLGRGGKSSRHRDDEDPLLDDETADVDYSDLDGDEPRRGRSSRDSGRSSSKKEARRADADDEDFGLDDDADADDGDDYADLDDDDGDRGNGRSRRDERPERQASREDRGSRRSAPSGRGRERESYRR